MNMKEVEKTLGELEKKELLKDLNKLWLNGSSRGVKPLSTQTSPSPLKERGIKGVR